MPIDDALADLNTALAGPAQPIAPAEQPQSGVDAALADLAKTPGQLHAEVVAARPQTSGPVANLAAGANDTAANIIGAPVDAMTWALNKAHGLVAGGDQPWINNPVGGSNSIRSAMGWIGADPRNVASGGTVDQIARNSGSAAAAMVAPYLGARALIAGGVGAAPAAMSGAASSAPMSLGGAAVRMLGGPAPPDAGILRTGLGALSNAAVGVGASLGGQGAAALLPEGSPYRPLADFGGQMLGGGLVASGLSAAKAGINYGAGLARDTLAPLRRDTLEQVVGNRLRSAADNPDALSASLDAPELVPGSRPTTFQATGDQGIGRLQAGLPSEPFDARAAEQNAARVGALQNVAPQGNAGAVRDFLQQHLDNIAAEGDANVAAARQNAQQAFSQAGGQQSPVDLGALMRDQLEAAKSATKRSESALWQAIDPNGTLTIDATPVRQAAGKILGEIPGTARVPEGEEKAVLGFAQMAGNAMPFQDFAALRSRLLDATRQEIATNGQTPAWRRMQMLRQSMDDTIGATAARAAQSDPALLGRLGQQAGDYYGPTNAAASAAPTGGYSGGPPALNPDFGPSAATGVSGTAGQAGSRPGGAAGYQGISEPPQPQDLIQTLRARWGLEPAPLPDEPATWDAAAAARYRAAADATRSRAQTFNNPVVGPALQERGGMYRIGDSRLPERFISSPEGVQSFLAAGGDAGTLRDALIADLRGSATTPDGTLNPTRFASWQLRRQAALQAFPDVQQTLGSAASAQQAVDAVAATARQATQDFQRTAARHFLNAEPEQAVSSAMNGRNPVADFRALSGMVASDPVAKAGLQRAVADYLISRSVNLPVGDAEVGTMSGAAFNRLASRDMALGQVFSPEQMQALKNISADLQRASATLPSGPVSAGAAKGSVITQYLGHGIAGLGGYLLGGVHGAIEGSGAYAMGKTALDAMRRAGIERTEQLLTEALLNPDLAKTLLMKATPGNRPIIAQRLASQIGTLAGVGGVQAMEKRQAKPQPAPSQNVLPVRQSQAAPLVPAWGSLMPGGALRQAVP